MTSKKSSLRANCYSFITGSLAVFFGAHTQHALAQATTHVAPDMLEYSAVPPLSAKSGADPSILLSLSLDHQLFIKAYNDYDDIIQPAGEPFPVVETTYTHAYNYLGYFDYTKCYEYNNEQFEPTGTTADKTCPGDEWSGNFLNWVTMTRMDMVRLVLYGGYRSTDAVVTTEDGAEEGSTVLERAHLPHDAHSFAKYYQPTDTDVSISQLTGLADSTTGYTFCNTSKPYMGTDEQLSQRLLAQPPLMRVVQGNYSLWASGERFQCLLTGEMPGIGNAVAGSNGNIASVTGIEAASMPPAAATDYVVRVKACALVTASDANKCKEYTEGVYKPIGLLQKYSASNDAKFGLMTGGYETNKSYGVLRKNVASFADEINEDGTFVFPPLGTAAQTGWVNPLPESIIGSLNAMRIVDYAFRVTGDSANYAGTYRATPYGGDQACNWGINTFGERTCRNWGNPFNELLAESYRYLAGNTTASVDASGERDLMPGLSVAQTWAPPSSEHACPSQNVIGFNASTVSYDGDALAGKSPAQLGIGSTTATIDYLTDIIGANELVTGAKFLIGGTLGAMAEGDTAATAANLDGQCTPKTISGNRLSLVRGSCPEAPRLEGSYLAAGLAHYARTNDVTPATTAKDVISTFGVTLAGATPTIPVPVPNGGMITIVPACRNVTVQGNCALVAFKPVQVPQGDSESTEFTGKYLIGWEDSEQGGDYDLDLSGTISYKVTTNSLDVETQIVYESTNDNMEFGFVISGTGAGDGYDTFYAPSHVTGDDDGAGNDKVQANTSTAWCTNNINNQSRLVYCDNVIAGDARRQNVHFPVNSSTVANTGKNPGPHLESPLYYAAKWGSFTDKDDNGIPNLTSEWDVDGDGVPDGYAKVSQYAELEAKLDAVFKSIVKRPATGAAAAVNSNTLGGDSLMLQSTYTPEFSDGTKTASWVGVMNGLFIDEFNNLREDTVTPGELTDGDKVVEFVFDGGETVLNRYPFNGQGKGAADPSDLGLSLDSIKPIWSARDRLAALTNTTTQRNYGASAAGGRYIFTGFDVLEQTVNGPAQDGHVEAAETIDFAVSDVDDFAAFLDLADTTEAGNLVNYIRGTEIDGYRSRTVNWGDGDKVWRLGDITHSAPAIVARPSGDYHNRYSDLTYRNFRDGPHKDRRQMVYVGANDGMLHAFNAGFYDALNKKYVTELNGETEHPLGSEIWSYVPYNLLPHLKWLAKSDYSHAYYVDASVQSFDVNIFPNSTDAQKAKYPDGWGTILVVGMRFGGGDYPLDLDTDGKTDRTLRSSYIIMDVTDPEAEPTLIAEVTDEGLGYTLTAPQVVKFRAPNTENNSFEPVGDLDLNDWYLVFGSGPTDVDTAVSNQEAKLFYLDLKNARVNGPELLSISTGETNAYIGGITAADWNGDYRDDMLYFGVVGDGETSYGKLMQAPLNAGSGAKIGTPSALLVGDGADRIFNEPPLVAIDNSSNYWVFAGSGRFVTLDDVDSDIQNAYFGLRVNTSTGWLTNTPIDLDQRHLKDISDIDVFVDGMGTADRTDDLYEVSDPAFTTKNTLDSQFDHIMSSYRGWYREFPVVSEANVTKTAFSENTLVFGTYIPGVSECSPLGSSKVYVLDMFTGLPQFRLRNLNTTPYIDENGEAKTKLTPADQGSIIEGVILGLNVSDKGANFNTSLNEQGDEDTSHIPSKAQRRSWREIPLDELQ